MARRKPSETTRPEIRTLVKRLTGLVPEQRDSRTFEDFVDASYCALAKLANPRRADALEAEYMRIAGRLCQRMAGLSEAFSILQTILVDHDGAIDVLGPAAAELGTLNAGCGQFFTPFELTRMMAAMTLGELAAEHRARGYVTVHDPCVGSGAMPLAAHAHLRTQGLVGWFSCADISAHAARMAYVQLSLVGAAGVVEVRNSLEPPDVQARETADTLTARLFRLTFASRPQDDRKGTTDPPDISGEAEVDFARSGGL